MKTCKDFNMALCINCSGIGGYCLINNPTGGLSHNWTVSEVLFYINNYYSKSNYGQYFIKGIEVHMPEIYDKVMKLLILQ
jgi:hypothetical protein